MVSTLACNPSSPLAFIAPILPLPAGLGRCSSPRCFERRSDRSVWRQEAKALSAPPINPARTAADDVCTRTRPSDLQHWIADPRFHS